MAVNLVSPGVKIREVDLTIGRIDAINDQIGAIAGPFAKGPVDFPILIETEKDLLNIFGKPSIKNGQNEYWLSASSYLSYGGVLRVVRCDGSLNTANAGVGAASTELKIKSTEDFYTNQSSPSSWYWAAKTPGSWANNLKVCIIDSGADQRIAIGTFGVSAGFGITAGYATTVAGIGTVSTKTGFVKGLITKVNTGSIDVKITSNYDNATGTYTDVSYAQGSINEFKNGDNLRLTNNSSTGVKLEDAQISRFYGVVSAGSTVIIPTSSAQTFPSVANGQYLVGIGTTGGQFLVPTTPVAGNGTTNANGTTQTTILLSTGSPTTGGTVLLAVLNGETTGETLTSAPLDWYNEQTLGLTNSTVYWKNIAPKPGTSEYASERNGKNDELHVVVVDDTGSVTGISANIVEKYTNLSKASDGRNTPNQGIYYKDVIRDSSQFVYAGAAPTATISSKFDTLAGFGITSSSDPWEGVAAQGIAFDSIGAITYTLSGGSDYSGIGSFSTSLSNVVSSYNVFANPSEYSINFLISGPSGGTVYESQAKANALIAIANNRKDCIAVISPHRSGVVNVSDSDTQTKNIVEFFDPLTSSSYAIFDSGYKYMFDRFNNSFQYVVCNSDIAGLMARTSINQFPWYSPAGASRGTINNAIKLAYNPSQTQRDDLYTKRINPIIFSPGAGIILFGDKTAQSYASAFDRINVRRLFLTLEQTIEKASRSQLFEFNDLTTRANFINIVEPYLRDVQSKKGITDFRVICDESNNTIDIIDANQFKADIFIKPVRSINFIGLTFVATRTGVSFDEIIGTV